MGLGSAIGFDGALECAQQRPPGRPTGSAFAVTGTGGALTGFDRPLSAPASEFGPVVEPAASAASASVGRVADAVRQSPWAGFGGRE